MRCLRLSHAGLILAEANSSLVIDPGDFSSAEELRAGLAAAPPVAAVVLTHEHQDHWTPEHLGTIRALAPAAKIFTTPATARALQPDDRDGAGELNSVVTVAEGDHYQVGDFLLEFYGRRHEVIHSSIPVIANIGVFVNQTLAWGGDALARPPFVPPVLGVPIGSPWSNVSQVMDFTLETAPRFAFVTHDGMLSARGVQLYTARVEACLAAGGGALLRLPHASETPLSWLDLQPLLAPGPRR